MGLARSLNQALDSLTNTFGSAISYTQVVRGLYDPATGSAANTPTTTTVVARIRKAMAADMNTLIQQGDLIVIISNPLWGVIPKVRDTFSYDGKTYKVKDVRSMQYVNECIGYELIGTLGEV